MQSRLLPRCIGPVLSLLLTLPGTAAPLSKSQSVDFYRDTHSRDLTGAVTRSDGRVLPGPSLTPLTAKLDADLLWTMAADNGRLLLGTGPEGRILRFDPKLGTATGYADLPDSHVFALLPLPDGTLVAGTSPEGNLILLHEDKELARIKLPVTSVLDMALLPAVPGQPPAVLVATGNPGRIYRVDLDQFRHSAEPNLATDDSADGLAARGITLWARIRDENIRRLMVRSDGRVIAGSAPAGNVYAFPAGGGPATVLAENREAEVTDLLPVEGGFYAALTFSAEPVDSRLKRGGDPAANNKDKPDAPVTDTATLLLNDISAAPRFRGRSQLVWFPDHGFPEVVMSRTQTAFYRLQFYSGLILITGGEEGELTGYDPALRRSLTLPGATSAQLNMILPVAGTHGAFYLLGNNPAALLRLDFAATPPATVVTKRLDLGVPAQIGALRFTPAAGVPPEDLTVELRASFSSREIEGWGDWLPAVPEEGSWRVAGLRGRYVQARLGLPPARFELPPAEIHYLPRNRRPQLLDFQVLSPNFMLLPAPERMEPPVTTLGQILQSGGAENAPGRNAFLSSQVVPQTGTQVVFWQMDDPDGDNFVCSFSLRHESADDWHDLITGSTRPFAQFETSHLPEGVYQSRLTVRETAPRHSDERLSATFSTADILVDRTAPEIIAASVEPGPDGEWRVRVTLRDRLSLPAGVEINFNNGLEVVVEQPVDGILDGVTESFEMTVSPARAAGATSVEIVGYDTLGNSSARRLPFAGRAQ